MRNRKSGAIYASRRRQLTQSSVPGRTNHPAPDIKPRGLGEGDLRVLMIYVHACPRKSQPLARFRRLSKLTKVMIRLSDRPIARSVSGGTDIIPTQRQVLD